MDEQPLDDAIQLLRNGKTQDARQILVNYLKAHPRSARGWYFLSFTLEDPGRQVECLQRALKLNPGFAEAQARLSRLTQPPEEAEPALAEPIPPAPTVLAPESEPEAAAPPDVEPQAERAAEWEPAPAAEPMAMPEEVSEPELPAPEELVPQAEAIFPEPVVEADTMPEAEPSTEPAFEEGQFDLESEAPVERPSPSPHLILSPQADETSEPAVKPDRPARARPRGRRSAGVWILLIIAVVVFLVALLVLYLLYINIQNQAVAALPTKAQIAILVTSALQSLPPTWTVTPNPTSVLTPTPESTPTLAPPNPGNSAMMDQIQQQVSNLRGLESQAVVARYLIPPEQVRDRLEQLMLEGRADLKAEVADEVRVLAALGLIKPSYDLYTKMLNNLGDGLGGFYIPWAKELYVIGEELNSLQRFVLSHEYDHALVDQHFNLAEMGVFPDCTSPAQRCEAIRALVEGDATLLMYQWLEAHVSEDEFLELFEYDPPTEIISSADFPPPYVIREHDFWYEGGTTFVEYLYDRGNWTLVNQAYQNLPQTTEQILHPEKYLADEGPIFVPAQPLEDLLGEGWRRLTEDVLGELTTYLILGYGIDAITQLDEVTAARAAAGWGGDSYQVYYRGATNDIVLAAHWIWDSPADAGEFQDAMMVHLDQLYAGNRHEAGEGSCWQRLNQEISCLFSQDLQTLWLVVPTDKIMELVKSRYPDFH